MPVYQLTPTETGHNDWRTSDWIGVLIVRAPDCRIAKDMADQAMGIAAPVEPGQDMPLSRVWSRFADCAPLNDPAYPQDGLDEILAPKEPRNRWRETAPRYKPLPE